ncbi:hypothetical protein ACEPT9_01945 [Burkholderia cenocepacia]
MTTAFAHATEHISGMGAANDRRRVHRSSVVADKTPLYQHKKMTYPYSMNTPRIGRIGWSRRLGEMKGK